MWFVLDWVVFFGDSRSGVLFGDIANGCFIWLHLEWVFYLVISRRGVLFCDIPKGCFN